jgi:hypothetical protein
MALTDEPLQTVLSSLQQSINMNAIAIVVSVVIFFSQMILLAGVRAESLDINAVGVAMLTEKIKSAGLQSLILGDFESFPYEEPSKWVLSGDPGLSEIAKLRRIYTISSGQMQASRIQRFLRDSISQLGAVNALALEALHGRSAVVVDLPSSKISAVAFLPQKGVRGGNFVVEFDPETGEVANVIIGR